MPMSPQEKSAHLRRIQRLAASGTGNAKDLAVAALLLDESVKSQYGRIVFLEKKVNALEKTLARVLKSLGRG